MLGANAIADRLAEVRRKIHDAAVRAGRSPDEVRLLAVSKAKPADAIRAAYDAGQRDFGENYAQELAQKAAELADVISDPIRWHFIGRLQRNKAKLVAPTAFAVHAVDRLELATELGRRASSAGKRLQVFVEVNVSGEVSKGGCSPAELGGLLTALGKEEHLLVAGLMTIPPDDADLAETRKVFAALRELRDRHRAALGPGELSMGMSHDFEAAIEEGATVVRVGSAIFGPR